jgi:hypothetical protein
MEMTATKTIAMLLGFLGLTVAMLVAGIGMGMLTAWGLSGWPEWGICCHTPPATATSGVDQPIGSGQCAADVS